MGGCASDSSRKSMYIPDISESIPVNHGTIGHSEDHHDIDNKTISLVYVQMHQQ